MTDRESELETWKHIQQVRVFLDQVVIRLLVRGHEHDISKLEVPEVEYFNKFTPKLRSMVYGSEEYKRCLREMEPALEHHYANNRHHPEHFPDGVNGMHLIDVIEMLCDWRAASLRTAEGDILKSLEYNRERFGLSDQLYQILRNTAQHLWGPL